MKLKFPRRREDGTFSVLVVFGCTEAIPGIYIDHWLRNWAFENSIWTRMWKSRGNVTTETLLLTDAFQQEPYRVCCGEKNLCVRLDATSKAPLWKDWMIRLIQDMQKAFPVLNFEGAESVE